MISRFAVTLLAATLLLPNVSDAGNGKDKLN